MRVYSRLKYKFLVFTVLLLGGAYVVYAAGLTNLSDTMTDLTVDATSDHEIVFDTPSGIAGSETVDLTFATGFDISTITDSDVKLLDDGSNATFTSTTISGQTLTITNDATAIAADSTVTVQIGTNAGGANQITNPSTAGTYAIDIAGTFGDTGSISVEILTDSQVNVTADVDQSVTFSISDNAIGYGTLDSGTVRYATADATGSTTEPASGAHTLSAGTNASSGYTTTVEGSTLTSQNNDTITIIGGTATTPSAGTEQFGIRLTSSGGSGSVSAPYNTTDYAYDGVSAADEIATATTSTATTTYDVHYVANIAAETPAGSYSTDLTYVATANF